PLALDLGRGPLRDLREHPVVDQRVDLGLAHHVDEPRSHHQPSHVQRLARLGAVEEPHGDDPIASDGDVPFVAGIAAAIHDPPVLENQVVPTRPSSLVPLPARHQRKERYARPLHPPHPPLTHPPSPTPPSTLTPPLRPPPPTSLPAPAPPPPTPPTSPRTPA